MRIGIVGGRLQGMEAAYLCKEAGYETVLFDRDPHAPARFLADEFHRVDLLTCGEQERNYLLRDCALVIPAVEDHRVLSCLASLHEKGAVPVAVDLRAYETTSSKVRSAELMAAWGVQVPSHWPECGFPVIVKPSSGSGSEGVRYVSDEHGLQTALEEITGPKVVQKYLRGPAYSLEVLANRQTCLCLQVTQLEVDPGFDCKRVLAGPHTGRTVTRSLCDVGQRIATGMGLSGIMDIEVIATAEGLQVLEIDARLPSQTPSAVYHATGLNMIVLLSEYWTRGNLPVPSNYPQKVRGVVYEHYRFHGGVLEVSGEHVLADASHLRCYTNRFSAERLITNCEAHPDAWVATAIYVGDDETQAWNSRNRGVKEILDAFGARAFRDPGPAPEEEMAVD